MGGREEERVGWGERGKLRGNGRSVWGGRMVEERGGMKEEGYRVRVEGWKGGGGWGEGDILD